MYLSSFLWHCFEHQSHNDKPKQLKWIVVNITVSLTNAPDKCQECTASLLPCFDSSVYFLRGDYGLEWVLRIIFIAAYILFIQQTQFPTRMHPIFCITYIIQKHIFFPFLYSVEAINYVVFLYSDKEKRRSKNLTYQSMILYSKKFVTRSCCMQAAFDNISFIRHKISVRS